jgi:hypothetical protein
VKDEYPMLIYFSNIREGSLVVWCPVSCRVYRLKVFSTSYTGTNDKRDMGKIIIFLDFPIKYNQQIVCWEARAGRGVLCSTPL